MVRSALGRLRRWLARDDDGARPAVDLYPLHGVTDPQIIADALVGHRAPRRLPAGEVVLAELTSDVVSRLRDIPAELHERRRDVQPCLIAVCQTGDANEAKEQDEPEAKRDDEDETGEEPPEHAHELAVQYAKTVLVAEDQRGWVPDLVSFLPALFHPSAGDVTGIGSARVVAVDVSECPPDPGILVPDLRARNGKSLHPIANEPELFAFTAPTGYADIVQTAFEPRGTIIGRGTVSHDRITVVGFSFQEPKPSSSSSEAIDVDPDNWAPDLPRAPTGQTGGNTNPRIVKIKRSVLNEIAAHAVATPDIEVYGALYADTHGRISHYHPIESESHVLRTESSVRFTDEFDEHMRTLAGLYDGIGCRLAGDCHSHPSGSTRQSERDKETARNVWRNERNTCLIVGIADSDGPNSWEPIDGALQKQVGSQVVRIAAYSGTTAEKTIRISESEKPQSPGAGPGSDKTETRASHATTTTDDHVIARDAVAVNRSGTP